MPKISVIVPIYNTERYLPQCLDSIRAQTHSDLEILLVDDGSPDGCGEICDEYAARDHRIRVIHQENRGLSAGRNAGLDTMTGEFVSFVDSDDIIAPDMLESLLRAMETGGADVGICNFQLIPGGVCPIGDSCMSQGEFLEKLLEDQAWFYITATNKLYRRGIFRELRFPEGYIHEDEAVIYRIVAQCGRIVTLSRPLYFYRRRSDSITGRGVGIGVTDKLYALADRIVLSREMGWTAPFEANAARFAHSFFDYYHHFSRNGESTPYFARMEDSLKAALPHLWRAKGVSLAHKAYLTLIRLHPKLYLALRTLKRGDTP